MTNANIYQNLRNNWRALDGIAFQGSSADITYRQMDAAVAGAAAVLADMGLNAGDRVAMALPKSTATFLLMLTIYRSGLVLVPFDPAIPAQMATDILDRTAPSLLLVGAGSDTPAADAARAAGIAVEPIDLSDALAFARHADKAPAPAEVDTDTPAIILFTSGSTGRPKGVPITHGALMASTEALAELWQIGPTDRLLHALPLTHAHGGIIAPLPVLCMGGAICLRPRFEPGDIVARLPDATCYMAVPFGYAQLMDHPGFGPETCAGVRLFVSGSAPLPDDLRLAFQARTGKPIHQRYGMTETLITTGNGPAGHRGGSVGRAVKGVTLRIRPLEGDVTDTPGVEGEVEVQGPTVLRGYLAAPEETAAAFRDDGFFRTGDLGVLDEDGFLTITGRAKDLIVYAGLKVHPAEVEAALRALDGVADACVFGVPHPSAGESVIAAVVPAPGFSGTAADLRKALVGQLATTKLPKRIYFLPDLPRNAMGKLQRTVLRDRHADGTLARTGSQPGLRPDTST